MYPTVMGILLPLGLLFFGYTIFKRFSLLLAAKGSDERWREVPRRFIGIVKYAFAQVRLLKVEWFWGLMHAFIFWGFIVVSLRTITLFGQAFSSTFDLPFLTGTLGNLYSLSNDFFKLLVVVGVLVLLVRRIIIRPKRLTLSLEANLILVAIGLLMITDFLIEGAEFSFIGGRPSGWSPIGLLVSKVLNSMDLSGNTIATIYVVNHFLHTAGILIFLNYLPYGKHFHIITAIPNVFFRRLSPYGALSKINLEDENTKNFGIDKINEFSWKQYLDLYSCTECGRCQDQCPAFATDKPLSPKELSIKLREHLYKSAKDGISLVPKIIDPETLWSCTTCRACEEACPVFIEYVDKIVDMRRNLVLMRGELSLEAQTALKNIETNYNPWGIGYSTRGDWAKNLGVKILRDGDKVDYLYFVGCAGSFDERAKKISAAFVKLLQKAGVSFGILGENERCTGDSARRIGNEYLFQMLARENIEIFNRYGVKKIITTCPHCYNTIKNEFPQFCGKYEVFHHTEFLLNLVKEGKLTVSNNIGLSVITYHDSCYLGRYNGMYDQPRELLKLSGCGNFTEMKLGRELGRCCGAGGGRMWMEESAGTRMNHKRLEDIKESGAKVAVTACPFCLTMLQDGAKEKGDSELKLLDIAEILT